MSIPELKEAAVAIGRSARSTAQGGAVFLAGEYISEAVMAAAKGDWSGLENLSATDVLKNYGALTIGNGLGVAANESVFTAFPALARVPHLKAAGGHYIPMLAAILLMQKVNGEETTAGGLALTMGNLAVAQTTVLPLRRGIQILTKTGKLTKRGGVVGMVIATALEFVILKALGEAETAIIMKAPLKEARSQIASLIMEHNEMTAKMQRGEFVSAAALAKNQAAMLAWQARLADMTEEEAKWKVRKKLAALDELDELDYEPCPNDNIMLTGMYCDTPVDHAAIARQREALIAESRQKVLKRAEDYTSLPIASAGKVPFGELPQREQIMVSSSNYGLFSDPEYYYQKERQVTVAPRQTAYSNALSDSWTGLYNQLGDYVARSNEEMGTMIAAATE